MGRFLSLDPLREEFPSESNYIYGANSPIVYYDYDGKGPDSHVFESSLYLTNPEQAKTYNETKTYVANHGGIEAGIIGISLPFLIRSGQKMKGPLQSLYQKWQIYDPSGLVTGGTIAGFLDPNPAADYPGFWR